MNRVICAVIAAGLLTAGPLAGRAGAEEAGKDGGGRGERVEKMMKERLGLSDDQAAKLKTAWKTEREATKSLREQSKESTRKLEEEVRGLASDKEIQATLDQLDADRKAMAGEHQKIEAEVSSVLKPYQRAKLRLFMEEGMKRRGHWNRDGRGHDGSDRRRDEKDGEGRGRHDDD